MRAAGQIGEFAGDHSQPPQFGPAMAEIGGKSAGGALRPNEQAGHRDPGRPPLTTGFFNVKRMAPAVREPAPTRARIAPATKHARGGE